LAGGFGALSPIDRRSLGSIARGMLAPMFEGLSKHEIIGWAICLAVALGLTLSGGAYLATSLMSADVSDAMPSSGQNFRK
jgi:hypothetical protein